MTPDQAAMLSMAITVTNCLDPDTRREGIEWLRELVMPERALHVRLGGLPTYPPFAVYRKLHNEKGFPKDPDDMTNQQLTELFEVCMRHHRETPNYPAPSSLIGALRGGTR